MCGTYSSDWIYAENHWYSDGGTTAVAPLMAALAIKLNQAKKKNVGFLNPFLYQNVTKQIVHAVMSGNSIMSETGDANSPLIPGYYAGPGWNACTGLGTPDGTERPRFLATWRRFSIAWAQTLTVGGHGLRSSARDGSSVAFSPPRANACKRSRAAWACAA
jgi:hypothetical protein